MISALPVTAASGSPPPRLLAVTIRSGSMSSCSIANILPVRPKPVCTSSAMKRMPCLRQIPATAVSHPGGGTMKPPSPCTGQRKPAAEALGGDHQVRFDVFVLNRKHLAGAAEARLHFVGDEEETGFG